MQHAVILKYLLQIKWVTDYMWYYRMLELNVTTLKWDMFFSVLSIQPYFIV